MVNIEKRTVAEEKARLRAMLDKYERRISRAFSEYVDSMNDYFTVNRIARLVEAGRIDDALAVAESYAVRFAGVMPRIVNEVGEDSAAVINEMLTGVQAVVTFNPSNPRAAELARNMQVELAETITRGQEQLIRNAISSGLTEGRSPRSIARDIRQTVGLTSDQNDSVMNYRRLLEENSSEALTRELRDRRFDRTLEQRIRDNEPLSRDQIDRMTERYRQRYINFRSETIAITQSTEAVNAANEEAFRQASEQAGFDVNDIEGTWQYTRDNRTRDWHANMQDAKAGINEDFIDGLGNRLRRPGDPSAPLNTRIRCRCVVTYQIRRR